jgi:hypothetical protein
MLEQCAQPQRRAEREVRARLLRVLRLRTLLQPGAVRSRATHRLLLGLSLSTPNWPRSPNGGRGFFVVEFARQYHPGAILRA